MPRFEASARPEPDATRVSDVDPAAPVLLTVVLRPGAALPVAQGGPGISHAQYRARHATLESTIALVRAFAQSHGLSVVSADAAAHVVQLRGTYAQAIAAFTPEAIGLYENQGRRFVARSGHLHLPASLMHHVVAVMGMDQRPVARTHFRAAPSAVSAAATSYDPTQVASAYQFPTGLDGTGQTIAIIELGGGYADSDVAAYFSGLGITRGGTLVSIGVDGAANAPDGDPNGADGEVQLDIEVAGAIAPGANIAVYFGPNQGSGFHDAISAAVNDQSTSPSVISISWGGPESGYSQQDLDAFEQVLQQAATLGITVCAASGDNGSSDGVTDGSNNVDYPSSSPSVLGCGGTSLPPGGPEVAWNDGAGAGASGGGFSTHFAQPGWQAGAVANAMRGVPDVAGNADPATGYQVSVDGQPAVIGGTSAVAPLWAGLIALVNQSLASRVGLAQPALYGNAAAFTDIVQGDNGAFAAGPGWDAVTGLGSPVGTAVLSILGGAPAGA